jgi:putative acetyltransferase
MVVRDAEVVDLPRVRVLLDEYRHWIGLDLSYQGFQAELDGLPGAYAPPAGALLVGVVEGEVQGIIASRPLTAGVSEMKRLFVRSGARGHGMARALIAALIDRAEARGDHQLVLDTLPMMADAQRLYESMGFRDVAPYYDSPVPGTRFMALGLPYN